MSGSTQKSIPKTITSKQAAAKRTTASIPAVKKTTGKAPAVKKISTGTTNAVKKTTAAQKAVTGKLPAARPTARPRRALLFLLPAALLIAAGIGLAILLSRQEASGPQTPPAPQPASQPATAPAQHPVDPVERINTAFKEIQSQKLQYKDDPYTLIAKLDALLKQLDDLRLEDNRLAITIRGEKRRIEDDARQHVDDWIRQAETLIEECKYDEAVAHIDRFPPKLTPNGAPPERLAELREEAHQRKAFEAIHRRAQEHVRRGELPQALELYRKACEQAGNVLRHLCEEQIGRIEDTIALGGVESRTRQLLARRREEAVRAIQRIEQELKEEDSRQQQKVAQQQERLVKATAQKPVRVVTETGSFQAKVVSWNGQMVAFDNKVTASWNQLPWSARFELAQAMLDQTPGDCLELGKLAVRARNYDAAEAYFKKVPGLEGLLPDVSAIRRKAVLHGEYLLRGNDLLLAYDFALDDERADFDGTFELKGARLCAKNAVLKAVPFTRPLAVHAQTPSDATISSGEISMTVARDEVRFVVAGKTETQKLKRPASRIGFELTEQKLVFFIDGAEVWSGPANGATVGHVTLSGEFRELRIRGTPSTEWLRGKLLNFEAFLERELSRHLKRADESNEPRVYHKVRTSLDDLIEELPVWPREKAREIRWRLGELFKNRDEDLYGEVTALLKQLAEKLPNHCLPSFYSGLAHIALRKHREAVRDLTEAIRREPAFADAYAARAEAWLGLRLNSRAGEDLKKAYELMPDIPNLYAQRARLALYAHKKDGLEAALRDIRIAQRLAPEDAEIELLSRRIRLEATGATARMFQYRSKHYLVRGEISEERCRELAEHLEAAREALYRPTLGDAPEGEQATEVVVFGTREAYLAYTDIHMQSDLGHTGGVFFPLSNQIFLYEQGNDTVRTLYHEGFHEYLHQFVPNAPGWLNEGMAEYLAGSQLDVAQKRTVRTDLILRGRLLELRYFLGTRREGFPFEEIMSHRGWNTAAAETGYRYAQAWSMIHFFNNSKYKSTLQEYIRLLVAGERSDRAFQKTFKQLDLNQVQKEWLSYVATLN